MMPERSWHLAIDLGAESGRVMLGALDAAAGQIELREIHRFPTPRLEMEQSLRWDVPGLFEQIITGLSKAAVGREAIASVSVDSWGVDYVLLGGGERLAAAPFMYRDSRTDAAYKRLMSDEAARRTIFRETGIQFLHFNTLYQLVAELEQPGGRGLHQRASGMLMMGDYLNWRLCGVARGERSLASTSQLYNPRTRSWSGALVDQFGIRRGLLPELADSGTVLGPLLAEVAQQTGLRKDVQVVATCSHDTAAAVAATPLVGDASAYLSSGTWSLLGVELAVPIITDSCRELGFTNEIGYGNTIRLLKNISGLFMLQECRGEFLRPVGEGGGQEQPLDYAFLAELAGREAPLQSLIRPDAPQFARPGQMTQKIAEYCRRTGQPAPQSPGQFARCIYESLALLYAQTLAQIQGLTGRRIDTINVVGGGSRSELLNQLTADACEVVVEAGPDEATALGNIGIQAIALGGLGGIAELRRLVRQSFPPRRYQPRGGEISRGRDRFANLRTA